ncbi:MAG: transport-associated protein [Lacunisphaera sp.]|nr:transport-associated protein [Lacunisphaera sp.]
MKKLLSPLVAAALLGGFVAFNAACSSTATRESTGEYVDDSAITAKVKAALIHDETVKAGQVNVETFKGVVQLSGFVDNSAQKMRSEDLARGVNGVVSVTNNIQLKANQP